MPASDRQFRLGLLACWLLALLCLGFGIASTMELLRLLDEGERADAVVTGIDVGARNTKRAILEFTTRDGTRVNTRDTFQLFLIRPEPGEHVRVIYDPVEPETATIDLGPWTWQQPVMLYGGFVFLAGLAIVMARIGPGRP